ncbi:hypothetical protein MRB53_033919 [Persea americana]|uniref:Uncharacterized protein n=1 Tax=Persea americana TaxID=3435 RepID=A0ACC2KVW7_PERAE|nr:hypothetical protein MRB53_033919 [Persea americana]
MKISILPAHSQLSGVTTLHAKKKSSVSSQNPSSYVNHAQVLVSVRRAYVRHKRMVAMCSLFQCLQIFLDLMDEVIMNRRGHCLGECQLGSGLRC